MEKRFKRSSSAFIRDQIVVAFGAAVAAPLAITAIAAPSALDAPASANSFRFPQKIAAPLIFEANVGQADGDALFIARPLGYRVAIRAAGFDIRPEAGRSPGVAAPAFSVRFTGASAQRDPIALERTGGVSRYYGPGKGIDQPLTAEQYRRIDMGNLYPGIGIVYYGSDRQLEYDFVLAPHADPRQIALAVSGIERATLDSDGNLNLFQGERSFSQKRPVAYQQIADGVRVSVDARYVVAKAGDGTLSVNLDIGAYDHSKALIIDPLIINFSRTLGGLGQDYAYGVAADGQGNVYVVGSSSSSNFPGATALPGGQDPYVTKLGASGDVIYTTYLQTNGAGGWASGVAVDAQGNAYVAGTTFGPLMGQQTYGGSDAFAAKLGASGGISYLKLLGGSNADYAYAVALDHSGNAYVAGTTSSINFLGCTKQGKSCGSFVGSSYLGGTSDGFIVKLGASGQTIYESFIGGPGEDGIRAVALDPAGNPWTAGYTNSGSKMDVYLSKVGASGSVGVATQFGGSDADYATGLGFDAGGNAYLIGKTFSSDFPLVAPFQSTNPAGFAGFVSKYNPNTRALAYSSYLGGNAGSSANAIAVEAGGSAYIAGSASGPGALPILGGGYQQAFEGTRDGLLLKVGSAGTLDYSTFLGGAGDNSADGVALGSNGRLTVVGSTTATDFPVTGTAPAISLSDAFVTQFDTAAATTTDANVYNIPAPQNSDQPFIRIYNISGSAGAVRATLYSQDGTVLGTPNSLLISTLPANAVQVLTAANIAAAVRVTGWTGRAWMTLTAGFPAMRVENLIRSGSLINMSCVESQNVYVITDPSNPVQAFVRLYNTSNKAGTVHASLYDQNGNLLGNANSVLVSNLAAHAVLALSSSDMAAIFGVTGWTGRAWMRVSSDINGLKMLGLLRDPVSNTLTNVSCDSGSGNTVSNVYNIPAPNGGTNGYIRLYNTAGSTATVIGTMYSETGDMLGAPNSVLGTIAPNAVMVLSQDDVARLFAVSGWTGRAWMEVTSSLAGLKVANFNSLSLLMDMGCVENNYAYNIPAASNGSDRVYLRLYNTSTVAGNVYGTLYDESGAVLGVPNSLLVAAMPSKSVAVFDAASIAASVGVAAWTGRASMRLSSDFAGLKVLNILEDVASGNWSNVSCSTTRTGSLQR